MNSKNLEKGSKNLFLLISFLFYSNILWNIIINFIYDWCINRKKKNHPEQKLKKEANSCSGWFFSFPIDIPIINYIDWCFNRKKRKITWNRSWKRKPTLVLGDLFLFYWYTHHELHWLVFQWRKRKITLNRS